jgi:hypothetical protein
LPLLHSRLKYVQQFLADMMRLFRRIGKACLDLPITADRLSWRPYQQARRRANQLQRGLISTD